MLVDQLPFLSHRLVSFILVAKDVHLVHHILVLIGMVQVDLLAQIGCYLPYVREGMVRTLGRPVDDFVLVVHSVLDRQVLLRAEFPHLLWCLSRTKYLLPQFHMPVRSLDGI